MLVTLGHTSWGQKTLQVAAVDTIMIINHFCLLSNMLYGGSGVLGPGDIIVGAAGVASSFSSCFAFPPELIA